MAKKPVVGIIGYGDFAKLLVGVLSQFATILVSSRQNLNPASTDSFIAVSLREVLAQDIIIPSLPAQLLEEFFQLHYVYVNPKALVVDVCSVKVKPVQVLLATLPKTTQILATHPLFGPASTDGVIKDKKIMMYPVRMPKDDYKRAKHFAKHQLGLKVIECTPEEHDHAMANVQGLSHYIGRAMKIMGIPETELATQAYQNLLEMKRTQGHDSWELFQSIMQENPYVREVHDKLHRALTKLDTELGLK